MSLYEKLVSGEEKLSLVGLGYVGMPIAVAFAKKIKVVSSIMEHKDAYSEKVQKLADWHLQQMLAKPKN